MLVPVAGGVAELQKRVRNIHQQEAALSTVAIPSVYIFNVGPREWRNRVAAGKGYTIPACPSGELYSEPVTIPTLCLSEIDLADGANNMGVVMNSGISETLELGGVPQHVIGVANDLIGCESTNSGLDLSTTNLEWFGVFVSRNEIPTDEELEEARGKLRQMMDLIYSKGAEFISQNIPVPMIDRKNYNEAAEYLGRKPLFGTQDHMLDRCPECKEAVIGGATFCKHCQQAIDPASVAARSKKRMKANQEDATT